VTGSEGFARLGIWLRGPAGVAVLLCVAVMIGWQLVRDDPPTLNALPPPAEGYFSTLSPGSWSSLPSGKECREKVHRSTWEPRPDNWRPNHTMPNSDAVQAALAARPRAVQGAYDQRWDSWLLARVTGRHTGSTDENIQWVACKWGIADNLLRAMVVRESTWFQYEVYPNGRCVENFGCGDIVPTPNAATRRYCDMLVAGGRDYQEDYGAGRCPRTFSIAGVMSWHAPEWGAMPGNQNGTFPFNRNSTAFALDYLGGYLRGCYEGWIYWLGDAEDSTYAAGDIWGCVGAWFAGVWRSQPGSEYVANVKAELRRHIWLDPTWAELQLPCSPTLGCPRGP
jgi:hypothetical protein